jgi:hypothetical protein
MEYASTPCQLSPHPPSKHLDCEERIYKAQINEEVLGVSGDSGEPERMGAVCADGGGGIAILFAACAGD